MTLTPEENDVLEEHRRRLLAYAGVLFYGASGEKLGIDPLQRTTLMLGFYVSTRQLPAKQRTIKPFPEHEHKIPLKYLLTVDRQPVPIIRDLDSDDENYLISKWEPSGSSIPIPLLHWSTLADFSEDDQRELENCGVPKTWAKAFGGMSKSTRGGLQDGARCNPRQAA
jgi:hypothetical protein